MILYMFQSWFYDIFLMWKMRTLELNSGSTNSTGNPVHIYGVI